VLTRRRIFADVGRVMVRLHAPEAVAAELRQPYRSSLPDDRSALAPGHPSSESAHLAITDV